MRNTMWGVGLVVAVGLGVFLAIADPQRQPAEPPPDSATVRASVGDAPAYVHLRITRDGRIAWRATASSNGIRWGPFADLGGLVQDDPKASMEALKALHRSGPLMDPPPAPPPPWEAEVREVAAYRFLLEADPAVPWRYVAWISGATLRGTTLLGAEPGTYVDLSSPPEEWPGPPGLGIHVRVVSQVTGDAAHAVGPLEITAYELQVGGMLMDEAAATGRWEVPLPRADLTGDALVQAWEDVTQRVRGHFDGRPCHLARVGASPWAPGIRYAMVFETFRALHRSGCANLGVDVRPAPPRARRGR